MFAFNERDMKNSVFAQMERTPESGEKNPGLYLHIPFCRRKCAYCSFVSYPCVGDPPDDYLAAVMQQLEDMAGKDWSRQRTFESFFIGGGTPTIYESRKLARLIRDCLSSFQFVDDPEVSVETNPNTVDRVILDALHGVGVNRLSIGVQTFSDCLLQAIGRTHSARQAEDAFRVARQVGFDNINLDLIFGLPGQTTRDFKLTLKKALELAPEHMALYELMLEEGSLLTRKVQDGEVDLPSEDEVADMADMAYEMLAAAGYSRYEISNFSQPGRECRHNIIYWENGSYLGLGAGAVSCMSGVRLKNIEDPKQFISLVNEGRPPYLEGESLSLEQRFRETVIMGLRMIRGVSLAELENRFALTPEKYYGKTLQELMGASLIECKDGFLRLTVHGLSVANQILAQLV